MNRRISAVVLVLLLAGCPASGTGPTPAGEEPTATTTTVPAPTTATQVTTTVTQEPTTTEHTAGESFVVGTGATRLRYTVTGVNASDRIGGEFGISADAQFVSVALIVTNVGENRTRLTFDRFALIDSRNQTYLPDQEATLFVDEAITARDLAPGATVRGVVVFDVPLNQRNHRLRVAPSNATSTAEAHYVELG
jgi:hypothetical protein